MRSASAGQPGISVAQPLSTTLLLWLLRWLTLNTNNKCQHTKNKPAFFQRIKKNLSWDIKTLFTTQLVNKWYPELLPPRQKRGHSFAALGSQPSIQILRGMPPVANLGVPALLAVQLLLLKWDCKPSKTCLGPRFWEVGSYKHTPEGNYNHTTLWCTQKATGTHTWSY